LSNKEKLGDIGGVGESLVIAFVSSAIDNLPAGLFGAEVVHGAHAAQDVTSTVLIGFDLGPNLFVTGSLATILWLTALRREGLGVSGWTFLKLGTLVVPAALALAIVACSCRLCLAA